MLRPAISLISNKLPILVDLSWIEENV